MMNILLLTHIYPFPPNDGGRIVNYNTIKGLSALGHKLTVLTFKNNADICSGIEAYADIHIINKSTGNSYLRMLLNLFSRFPYTMAKYYDKRMFDEIGRILAKGEIDVVFADHLHMAVYGEYVKKQYPDMCVVLRQHNVESVIMERFYKNQKNIFKRLYAFYQYNKLYGYESRIIGVFDKCFAITENDRKMMSAMNGRAQVSTISAGVDIDKYHPISSVEDNMIVFLGAMSWLPNEDAAVWFAEKVFAKVREKVPGLKYYIVGKDPSERIKRLQDRDIVVTGCVEDEREYLAKAKLLVVPLRIGGGMRIKILNAMAMGKCIVSTSIGAEGIDVSDGKDILIADDENEFAEKVIDILNSDADRERIGARALDTISDTYTWERVNRRLESEIQSTVESKHE